MPPDPTAPRIRRWIVADPGLHPPVGHHHTSAIGLRAEAGRRGLDMTILGHGKCDAAFAATAGVIPTFRVNGYESPVEDPLARQLAAYIRNGSVWATDLRNSPVHPFGPDDVLLWPTIDATALAATAQCLVALPNGRRPRVAGTFHRVVGLLEPGSHDHAVACATLRLAAIQLGWQTPGNRLFLTATTPAMAEAIAPLVMRPVAICPVPIVMDGFRPASAVLSRRRSPDGQPAVAFPGIPRRDKRADQLPAILAAIAARLPGTRIVVQTDAQGADRLSLPPLPVLPGIEPRVGVAPEADYRRMFHEAAIVVLPHDRDAYRGRISGVFAEAVAAGCVTVVASDTTMAADVAAGNAAGIVYADASPAGIAEAVAEAATRIDTLSARAMDAIDGWQRRHGIGPWLDQVRDGLGLSAA